MEKQFSVEIAHLQAFHPARAGSLFPGAAIFADIQGNTAHTEHQAAHRGGKCQEIQEKGGWDNFKEHQEWKNHSGNHQEDTNENHPPGAKIDHLFYAASMKPRGEVQS